MVSEGLRVAPLDKAAGEARDEDAAVLNATFLLSFCPLLPLTAARTGQAPPLLSGRTQYNPRQISLQQVLSQALHTLSYGKPRFCITSALSIHCLIQLICRVNATLRISSPRPGVGP